MVDRDQDARAACPDAGGRPGRGRGAARCVPRGRAGHQHRGAGRHRRAGDPGGGRGAVVSRATTAIPATICTSVNEEVVHGIPARTRVLADGDLISIDCGAIVDGWHGDAAITVSVGRGPRRAGRPAGRLRGPSGTGWPGRVPGGRLTDISARGGGRARAPPASTGSSRTTAGTASAPRCTWTRRCRTTAGRAAARCWPGDGPGRRADAGAGRPGDATCWTTAGRW